jgi:hypothetical protein
VLWSNREAIHARQLVPGGDTLISAAQLLQDWICHRLAPEPAAWFREQLSRLTAQGTEKEVYLALGYATRKLGKSDLALSMEELSAATACRPGWDPGDWSIDQAARVAFVLASHRGDDAAFKTRLEKLFNTADIGELIAFYRAIPLYPGAALHLPRAREGARSAMQPIFEAVAHRNPYPGEHFDENAWNHMVLKALFVGSRLGPIQGLDARCNPRLTRMLCDYARERRAANRSVSPELWRCVGPHADASAMDDLARVLEAGAPLERRAAVLALIAARSAEADQRLAKAADVRDAALAGEFTWDDIAGVRAGME